MTAVAAGELRPGLVVRLDPALLRSAGGSTTNAEATAGEDRAVVGEHYFLVLFLDPVDEVVLAVPLFSDHGPGSLPLDEARKAGLAARWAGTTSFFSKWQHWWIPCVAIEQASGCDDSEAGNRRTYAEHDLTELERIADFRKQNRATWRGV